MKFIPSLILGEAFPLPLRQPGSIATAIRDALARGFFKSFEIPPTLSDSEFRAVANLAQANNLRLVCWSSQILASEHLNLSAPDESLRLHSVARLTQLAQRAADHGVQTLGILSGPDPEDKSLRPLAQRQLLRSLRELGASTTLRVVIEPLDRDAHKHGLLGPIPEAVALMQQTPPNIALSWDSGHVILNNEDPIASLTAAAPHAAQLHLSHVITDRSHPDFGDHHLPALDEATLLQFQQIVRHANTLTFPLGTSTTLAIEVRTQRTFTPADTIAHCESLLKSLLLPQPSGQATQPIHTPSTLCTQNPERSDGSNS